MRQPSLREDARTGDALQLQGQPLLGALALTVLWWLLWIGRSTLFFDEAYYWDWSRRLDFGYYDHPPLVAVLIRLATTLGGSSEFSVRVAMVACGVMTVWLAARAGCVLGGPLAGWLCLLLTATCPLFGILFDFAGPDAPLLLAWSGAVFAMVLAAHGGDGRWWYVAGMLVGVALLAKYTAGFLVVSLALYAALSSRRWLTRREPYLAAIPALLIFSPNLWWNARHAWTSIGFQTSHGACVIGARGSAYLYQTWLYGQNQVTLLGPRLAVLVVVATLVALARGLRGDDPLLLLACCTIVIAGVFFVSHGVRQWAAPGYFSGIVSAGVLVARQPWWQRRSSSRPRIVVAASILAGAIEFAGIQTGYIEQTMSQGGLLADNAARVDTSLLRPQPHWPEAARLVASNVAELSPIARSSTVFVADSYGTAAEMAYYLPGHPPVYSDANQYKLWPPPRQAAFIVFLSTDPPIGARVPEPAGSRVLVSLPIHGRSSVAGHFTAALVPNLRLASGASVLDDLLAQTEVVQQRCQ
jgi:hypothetical protein